MFQGFLAYTCEMDFACILALSNPRRARKAAQKAASLAIKARRPDLAYRANALLAAL